MLANFVCLVKHRSTRLCAVGASRPQVVRVSLFPDDYFTCSSHNKFPCSDLSSKAKSNSSSITFATWFLGFYQPGVLVTYCRCRMTLTFALVSVLCAGQTLVLRFPWNPNQGVDLSQLSCMKTDVEIKESSVPHRYASALSINCTMNVHLVLTPFCRQCS